MEHPPYSPDLSPCDFFLFPGLKKKLAGRKYTSHQMLGATLNLLRDIPEKDYEKAFKDWIKRLRLCVSDKGEFFEGLK